MNTILVTGGLGYIGSHIVVELLNDDFNVIIIDNLINSKIETLKKIKEITKVDDNRIKFFEINLLKKNLLKVLFNKNKIDWIIHCAGLKAVGESCNNPLLYYKTNLTILMNLLEVSNCKNLIFSSSATVYGEQKSPITEECDIGQNITNPYGQTKYMQEKILSDLCKSDNSWKVISLRYFNPVGSHSSGKIGEDPNGTPNNLMPYLVRVAKGTYKELQIFGDDYDTPDGTCLRDFIHVVDLAIGHMSVLKNIVNNGYYVYNLGTGEPISVKQLVETFEKINNIKINKKYVSRRNGDLPELYSNPEKANKELNWKTEKTIEDMVRDSWNFINQ
ncbi:MAG: UDP-glucose 4-epimerase GalE [Magnetococcales bacterium]|nr:UDP-glucose 4-epimerase GalE [Magnetococcales bacterium]|tara:strand:+ start:98539 stop:99534 length:996 start_codon:yes stop_codon:yes gene_type:complete